MHLSSEENILFADRINARASARLGSLAAHHAQPIVDGA